MNASHSIACIFAHPDDETFSSGGTLARYADAGIRWDVYSATDGDAGKSSGIPVSSRAELGMMRRRELEGATALLGGRAVEFGGHPDGALANVEPELLVSEIVRFIRRHRPTVVITFGPEGAPTGHPDHRAISRAATAAFFLAGSPTEFTAQLSVDGLEPHRPRRLYYTAWKGAWELPGRHARTSMPPTAAVDVAGMRSRKFEAFLLHATQRQHQATFETTLADREFFALAAGEAQPAAMVDDLFAGL